MKDWVILNLNKAAYLKMTELENDLDIYYGLGNKILKDKKMKLQQLWKYVILQDGNWSQQALQ